MKFPATTNELRDACYEYDNDATCRGCGVKREWWITPAGKKMPMSILPPENILKSNEEHRQPHFVDCPNAADFRIK